MSPSNRSIPLSLLFLCSVYGAASADPSRADPPDQPLGIRGTVDTFNKAFTFMWEPVTQTASGVPLTNLAGYNIYRRATPGDVPEKINSYVVPIVAFGDRMNGQTFYYSVRAVDTDGNESAESLLVDSSENANVIFLAGDGRTSLVLPQTINDLLQPSHNKYGVPLALRLKEDPAATPNVVRNLEFQFLRGDTKQEVSDISFSQADADIQISYEVINGEVPLENAPAGENGQDTKTVSPDQLTLYWYNGSNWIRLGGVNDKSGQVVSVKSSQLGRYQLRADLPSSDLALNKANIYPSLFTPNGDGFNDRVYMVLENPNNASLRGDIYDLFGRHVATLAPPTLTAGTASTLTWDGKTNAGSVTPSGLYVYRIQGDGRTITGTISVAR